MAWFVNGFTVDPQGQTLILSGVSTNGPVSTIYTDQAGSAPVSLPATISAPTTFYVPEHGAYKLTITQVDGSDISPPPVLCSGRVFRTVYPMPSIAQLAADDTGSAVPVLPMDSGRWFRLPFATIGASWAGLGGGVISWIRFPIGKACSVDAMGIQVNTASASSLLRMGIYADSGGAPGALLKDYGTIDSSSTGYKSATAVTPLSVSVGYIWLCGAVEGTFGTNQYDTSVGLYSYQGSLTLGGNAASYTGSSYAGGGLPASAPAHPGFSVSNRGFAPWIKVA
jgi:hypothetical protein